MRPLTNGRLSVHDRDAGLKPEEIHLRREGWTVKAVGSAPGCIVPLACRSDRGGLDSIQRDFDGSP